MCHSLWKLPDARFGLINKIDMSTTYVSAHPIMTLVDHWESVMLRSFSMEYLHFDHHRWYPLLAINVGSVTFKNTYNLYTWYHTLCFAQLNLISANS